MASEFTYLEQDSFDKTCSPRVYSHWTSYNLQDLVTHLKAGVLKPRLECRYDTLIVESGLVEQLAFIIPRGQSQGDTVKTLAETNMGLGSSLGMPLYAHWKHLRVHFERYDRLEDALEWKTKATVELVYGQNEPIYRGSPGDMVPILPKGGYKKIDRMIKRGVIKFWPWLEASLTSMVIGPTDCFRVNVRYSSPLVLKHPMRIKISLGPTICRP